MGTKHTVLLLLVLALAVTMLPAQSPAALERLQQKYTAEQLIDLESHTHYKYEGLLLFYAASFMVMDNGQPRAATEAEIRLIDLDQYNGLRQERISASVHDATLGKDILLLSRSEFEALVLSRLSAADAEAYNTYKAAAQAAATSKTAH